MAAPLLGLQQIVQFWIELCTPKSPAAGFEAEAVALPLVLPLVSLLCLCLPRKTAMASEKVTAHTRKAGGKRIVKKRLKKFRRHQSDQFKRVPESWRRPKGMESRVRMKFNGTILMPNIGYGSNKKTKHLMPNGYLKFTVSNLAELELLMMHNKKYAAEIAHNVSTKKREQIIERAVSEHPLSPPPPSSPLVDMPMRDAARRGCCISSSAAPRAQHSAQTGCGSPQTGGFSGGAQHQGPERVRQAPD